MIFPAEWEKHKAIWTAWPAAADLWLEDLAPAREEIAAMINALAEGEKIRVLVATAEAAQSAKNMLGSGVDLIEAPYGDIWLRDTGPIFMRDVAGKPLALRFENNGWGGKYDLPDDRVTGDHVAKHAGVPIKRFDFILEGGAVENDGARTLLTTRQCMLNPNRNKGWTEQSASEKLMEAFGVKKIVWLGDGMMNDHTDGHIDNIARFYAPGKVVCQSGFGDNDPNTAIFEQIAADLRAAGLDVTQVPSPGLYENEDGDPVPASHMNFIIGNETVVVPTYGTASADRAVAMIAGLFPGRRVIGAPSMAVLTGGGSFHCITQQEPA